MSILCGIKKDIALAFLLIINEMIGHIFSDRVCDGSQMKVIINDKITRFSVTWINKYKQQVNVLSFEIM